MTVLLISIAKIWRVEKYKYDTDLKDGNTCTII